MGAPDWVDVFPPQKMGDIPAIAMLDYRSVSFGVPFWWWEMFPPVVLERGFFQRLTKQPLGDFFSSDLVSAFLESAGVMWWEIFNRKLERGGCIQGFCSITFGCIHPISGSYQSLESPLSRAQEPKFHGPHWEIPQRARSFKENKSLHQKTKRPSEIQPAFAYMSEFVR